MKFHFADEMQDYVNDLANLVVEAYEQNDNTPVILIGHSMGNPYTLYMLNKQTQAWKDKYVQAHIAVAGPWGGAVKTLRLMASGESVYIKNFMALLMVKLRIFSQISNKSVKIGKKTFM